MWWQVGISVVAGLVICWIALAITLWRLSPGKTAIGDALRIVPDVIRLTRRLAADRSLPRRLRAKLWLLFGYLVMPVDLIPDFIPVIGYADDAIVVTLVLRSVVKSAGQEAVVRHWPGSDDGLAAVLRLCRSR
jgi:uncharacterized membrane protein YkvA (DUF1232 family)